MKFVIYYKNLSANSGVNDFKIFLTVLKIGDQLENYILHSSVKADVL